MGKFSFVLISILLYGALIFPNSVYAQAPHAMAQLKNANRQDVGNAVFTQQSDGVHIAVQVRNLPPGQHGIHIHAQGKCDPPGFTTAAGHFNPFGKQHGLKSPLGPHAGDLPNLVVAQDGAGSLDYVNPVVTLASGAANSLFKVNGTALVIHAQPDDEVTDPAGNSGARIACGIILAAPAPSFFEQYGLTVAAAIGIVILVAIGVVVVKRGKSRTT